MRWASTTSKLLHFPCIHLLHVSRLINPCACCHLDICYHTGSRSLCTCACLQSLASVDSWLILYLDPQICPCTCGAALACCLTWCHPI